MHVEIEKRLKESEALSTRAMKKLSEKQRIIQEQSKLIKEKEKESSTDGPSSKDKEILEAQEKLKKSLNGKSGLIQICGKGLRTMMRYQLEK